MGYYPWFKTQKILAEMNPNPLFDIMKIERVTRRISNRIPIGNTRMNFNGRMVEMDLSQGKEYGAPRIFVVAPTNAGKTTLISSILYQSYLAGFTPAILFDPHNEYRDKIIKSAEFFEDDVRSIIETITPYYLARGGNSFQFSMNDLTMDDMFTLFHIHPTKDEDSMKRIALKKVLRYLKLLGKEEYNIMRLAEVIEKEEIFNRVTSGNIHSRTRMTLAGRCDDIVGTKVLGDRKFDIEGTVLSNRIVDFQFYGWKKFRAETQSYIAIIQRHLYNLLGDAYAKGEKIRIMSCYDEVSLVAPAKGNPSCKDAMVSEVQETQKFGEAMIFSTQEMEKVDPFLISQSHYLLVSPLTRAENVATILSQLNITRDAKGLILDEILPKTLAVNEASRLKPWILISRSGYVQPFYPFYRV